MAFKSKVNKYKIRNMMMNSFSMMNKRINSMKHLRKIDMANTRP